MRPSLFWRRLRRSRMGREGDGTITAREESGKWATSIDGMNTQGRGEKKDDGRAMIPPHKERADVSHKKRPAAG